MGGSVVAEFGQPYGQFFGTGFLRDYFGRVVVNGTTGYPVVGQRKPYGTYFPIYLAVYSTLCFNGLTLSALLDGRKGGLFYFT
jgi:hypothetical protein